MKKEVGSAVDFLTQLMRPSSKNTENLENFNDNLKRCIAQHYENHWFPEKPFKGSGYRCLRINHQIEPIILQAATESGLTKEDLLSMLPNELTLWIDPREVSYRIGEDGSVGVLYEEEAQDKRNNNKNKQRNQVSTGPSPPSPVTVPSQSPVPQNRVSPVPMQSVPVQQQIPQQRMSPVHLSRSPVPMGSPVRTSPVPRYLQCSPTRPSSTTSNGSSDFAWDSLFDQQTSRYHQLAAQFQQHQLQQQQQQLNRHQNHQSHHSQFQHQQQHSQQQQCGRDFFNQANLNEAYDLKRLAAYVYS